MQAMWAGNPKSQSEILGGPAEPRQVSRQELLRAK